MALKQQRTLGELTTALSIRLGFGDDASSLAAHGAYLRQCLIDAQTEIDDLHGSTLREAIDEVSIPFTVADQYYYEIPEQAQVQEIHEVAIRYSTSAAYTWSRLSAGISTRERGYRPSGPPTRWQLTYDAETNLNYIEIWPVPDKAYPVQLQYEIEVMPFLVDADRATHDDMLIFLFALHDAKDHYGQKDAAKYMARFETRLRRVKHKQHQGERYTNSGFAQRRRFHHMPPGRILTSGDDVTPPVDPPVLPGQGLDLGDGTLLDLGDGTLLEV